MCSSNRRLINMDENRVTFLARNLNKSSSQGQIPISLTGVEFTRRWSLHILVILDCENCKTPFP
ncbi:MAG: hypothetical protein R3C28_06320, partial [Pirellulaceae bacterium]